MIDSFVLDFSSDGKRKFCMMLGLTCIAVVPLRKFYVSHGNILCVVLILKICYRSLKMLAAVCLRIWFKIYYRNDRFQHINWNFRRTNSDQENVNYAIDFY